MNRMLVKSNESDAVVTQESLRRVAIGRVVVCSSPKAGSGLGREQLDQLPSELNKFGIQCERISNIAEFARVVADRHESHRDIAVVAAGGDGTLALVAQHVAPEIPIVPMPMGTENLFARHFGYRGRADFVAHTIQRGHTRRLDAGLANGRLFLVMVTAGFDAEVVRAMHLTRRGHIRRWNYVGPILRAVRRYRFPLLNAEINPPPPDAKSQMVSSTMISGAWMMAFNLPRYAGELNIEPDAVADDGWLDQITFGRGSVWSGLCYLGRILTAGHLKHRDVDRRRVRRVLWTSPERTPYQIDGDYAGRLPVLIEVLPGRVTLLCPPEEGSG